MSETKFTPGEWIAGEVQCDAGLNEFRPIHTGGTHYFARVEYNGNPKETDANARLVASAPDLYAAVEAIVAACERERPDIVGRDDEYIYDELGSAMSGAYVAARAALAKVGATR